VSDDGRPDRPGAAKAILDGAEVDEVGLALGRQDDVARLDVAMDKRGVRS